MATKLLLGFLALVAGAYITLVPLMPNVYAAEKSAVAFHFGGSTNPVEVVREAAEILGFNPKADTFTLMNQNASQAVVQVVHNGHNHNVTLDAAGASWTISAVQ